MIISWRKGKDRSRQNAPARPPLAGLGEHLGAHSLGRKVPASTRREPIILQASRTGGGSRPVAPWRRGLHPGSRIETSRAGHGPRLCRASR